MTIQDQVRELIAGGKTKDALYRLSEELRGTEEGNTITLLQSRWANNHRSFSQGILTNSDYNMENNRINHALISVISELEASPSTSRAKQKAQEVVQQIYNIHIGDVVHGDKVSGDVIHGDKVAGDKFGGDKVMGDKNIDNRTDNRVIHNSTVNNDSKTSEPSPNPQVEKKKILFIAANPEGKLETYSGKEFQVIKTAIQDNEPNVQYSLEAPNFASNVDDFLRMLKRTRPAIVHLSMHGNAQKGLVFEDGNGNSNYVSTEVLASFFELVNLRERTVECVILSVCNSSQHAEAIRQYVDYAIGMDGLIPAEAAVKYTQGFYDNLLAGDDYEMAHKSALSLLRNYANQVGWDGEKPIADMPKQYTLIGVNL